VPRRQRLKRRTLTRARHEANGLAALDPVAVGGTHARTENERDDCQPRKTTRYQGQQQHVFSAFDRIVSLVPVIGGATANTAQDQSNFIPSSAPRSAVEEPRVHRRSLGTMERQRILAVASSGGHWVQLSRLLPAFDGHDAAFLTTDPRHRDEVAPARLYSVRDANRSEKLRLLQSAAKIAWVLLRERPDVIVSTGAAPGYLALRLGKLVGARTVWIDSMANAEELSLSGKLASAKADLCLTQWPHLADGRVGYEGAVL
jgi:hypothetical protein